MANLNMIMEISNLCKKKNIDMRIDESGILLSTYKNREILSKRYDLDTIGNVVENLPLEIIVDMFIEEHVLQFKRAAC